MNGSGSILDQMLEAAVRGGGLRGNRDAGRASAGGDLGGLGDLLNNVLAGGAPGAQRSGGGESGGLGDLLNSVLAGGAPGGASSRAEPTGGADSDIGNILRDFAKRASGNANAANDGGVRSDAGAVRRQSAPVPQQISPPQEAGEAAGGGLVKYGGLAVLATLAYKAYANWQAQQSARGGGSAQSAPSLADSGFNPRHVSGGPAALSDALISAMIAAMQADGVIDGDEQRRILAKLEATGIDGQDRGAVARQLTSPVDLRDLVAAASTPETAAQIYAASALAISIDTAAERRYLDALASALSIDEDLKMQLERAVGRA